MMMDFSLKRGGLVFRRRFEIFPFSFSLIYYYLLRSYQEVSWTYYGSTLMFCASFRLSYLTYYTNQGRKGKQEVEGLGLKGKTKQQGQTREDKRKVRTFFLCNQVWVSGRFSGSAKMSSNLKEMLSLLARPRHGQTECVRVHLLSSTITFKGTIDALALPVVKLMQRCSQTFGYGVVE